MNMSIERKRKRDQEEEMVKESVKLLGCWSTHETFKLSLALHAKGIAHEYIDEDLLGKKSELLLKVNPIHQTVPVLIHNGTPILDSLVILEYIDETWEQAPRFLPEVPVKKAKVRFWARFIGTELLESMHPLALTEGEAKEKVLEKYYAKLRTVEDGMRDLLEGGKPLVDEKNLSILDIQIWSVLGPYKSFGEALDLKLLDPVKFPLLHSWIGEINKTDAANKAMPDHSEMVSFLEQYVEYMRGKRASS